ncbi:MAG: DNA mismatch repair protein MutS [Armatimonadetes bacterium]|nr:DNA mismatch repair protein MutS [Armatimonadota bacterium]MDW8153453.1 DNA mismatch repair protein MutS [Armatimonadota bacterium]
MRQYEALRRAYPGTLLLFRLGDFYELFGEDAVVASRVLDLVLTSRPVAKGRRVPMCGIPHHALESYLARLVEAGFRVAICEQVEDPKKARGLVRREVVRVVTPGTVTEEGLLPPRANVYVGAVVHGMGRWGLAFADLLTGEFRIAEFPDTNLVREEVARRGIREVLYPEGESPPTFPEPSPALTPYPTWRFDPETAHRALCEQFGVQGLEGFGCTEVPVATRAAGALVQYLRETQRSELRHLHRLQVEVLGQFLFLDGGAIRSLELLEPLWGRNREATLLGALDRTRTAMGGRLLRQWITTPLRDLDGIRKRLDATEELLSASARPRIREVLTRCADLERLVGRCGHGSAHPRDLVALGRTLREVATLRELVGGFRSTLLRDLAEDLDPHSELADRIERALVPDPPVTFRDGGLIRDGYDSDLDALRRAVQEAQDWIRNLEVRERERTGIKSLKVGYNKVFGYYIEVSRAYRDRVPPHYERRQTLVGAERYVTPEMKEREALILNARERMVEREQELFFGLREEVARHGPTLLRTARAMATLDVLTTLAEIAELYGYTRPEVVPEPVLEIRAGRHPVVERTLREERFVPNDLWMDAHRRIAIVTGPNFAGKSTYLRQAALIVILAQMGSFVPAEYARVGLVDRIFTRIGTADDIASGRSTFLVEMQEVANLLHNATPHSLVLLDEVGRGTATYDGLSIAWAVVEYLWKRKRARVLFATHYHELTELAERLPGVFNLNVMVREEQDRIVFLHRVAEGSSDRSYGIHVARLAGLPREVVARAEEILARLEGSGERKGVSPGLERRVEAIQTSLALGSLSPGVGWIPPDRDGAAEGGTRPRSRRRTIARQASIFHGEDPDP